MRGALVALAVGAAAAITFLRWRPFRVEIDGSSMRPALEPGDWALAISARSVRRGDVVVLEHPERPGFELVKRVVAVGGDAVLERRPIFPGELWVEGDDPSASADSRRFGPVRREDVRARLVAVWWPPRRCGLL